MTYNLEDLIVIETRCKQCDFIGNAPTFAMLAEDTSKPLGKELQEKGYFSITCDDCQQNPE